MPEAPIDPGCLADWSPDAMFVVDHGGHVTYANRACEETLGWDPAELIGRSVLEFTHPGDAMLVLSSVESMATKSVGTPVEVRAVNRDGDWRCLEIVGRNAMADPAIGGIVCTARDLTQRRMWEVAAGEVTRFQQVVQHSSAIVMLVDAAGVVTSMNGAITRLLGHDPSVVVRRPLSSLAASGQERAVVGVIADAILHGSAAAEIAMRTADGRSPIPIRLEVVDLLDDPIVEGLVVTGHDISDLHEAQRHLEHLVHHDTLTGLPNRLLLGSSLEHLLAARRPLALLYVDLDRFKPVNDHHGHDVGDQLLVHVARRLTSEVAGHDIVARVGGDEFVVVALDLLERADAESLARRLTAVLRAPFDVAGRSVRISASVGVALARDGSSPASLIDEADRSMYSAKGPGTMRWLAVAP